MLRSGTPTVAITERWKTTTPLVLRVTVRPAMLISTARVTASASDITIHHTLPSPFRPITLGITTLGSARTTPGFAGHLLWVGPIGITGTGRDTTADTTRDITLHIIHTGTIAHHSITRVLLCYRKGRHARAIRDTVEQEERLVQTMAMDESEPVVPASPHPRRAEQSAEEAEMLERHGALDRG